MSDSSSGSRGGHPSTITPIAGPWDSPNVLTLKSTPVWEDIASVWFTSLWNRRNRPSGSERANGAILAVKAWPAGAQRRHLRGRPSPPAPTDHRVPAPGGEGSGLAFLRRFAAMPLARHVVVLAVVLFAALPLMHRGSMVSADEGAVLSQIWILEHRGGWGAENPAAAIDPSGEWFGIDIVESADGRYFPYAKHPLYPVLALGAFRVAGLPAVVALSTLGTAV